MIVLKHVDTIIKAVGAAVESGKGRFGISLTLAGNGPEKKRLERMSEGLPVKFMDFLPIAKVRELMRANDVFVLASDEHEGWGAVVNEALEEGMKVFGTYEAGASAAMLREDDLFHAGDWRRLADLLARSGLEKRDGVLKGQGIGVWTPSHAAESILGKTWMDGTVNQK